MTPLQALGARAAADVVLRSGAGELRAGQLAARVEPLATLFSTTGGCVSSRLDNGADAVCVELAARASGVAHVALPPFFSAQQIQCSLRDSGATLLLLPDSQTAPPGWESGCRIGGLRAWRGAAARVARPPATACITYTSGSTGEPRGICLAGEHLDRVAASLVAATASIAPRSHLCALPLSTLLEHVAGTLAALQSGARILLPSLSELGYSGAAGLDPARLFDCIERWQPESLILLPQMLLALVGLAEGGRRLPTSLRFVAVGGARVGTALLLRARRLGLPVFEGYGLSECGSVVSLNRPGAERTGSVGRVLPHVSVDADADGELRVYGASALGVLGAETRLADPWPTGDLGHVDGDGFVHVRGRRKSMFITSFGRNVSPEWIESELTQHPDLAQAAVFGEARPYNVAVLVPRAATGERRVQAALREVNAGLPDYARITRAVLSPAPFQVADGTLTANGRLRRDAIARRHAAELEALYSPDAILEGDLVP